MSRPRLLDLFAGAGGSAVGYHRAGFEVVGVDLHPQPNYPYEFKQDDALDVLRDLVNGEPLRLSWHREGTYYLRDFDAIHASPPCQAYTMLRTLQAGKDYPDLIAPTRELLQATGLPYVLENVPGATLRKDYLLCGSMFNLGAHCADGKYRQLRRHRWFETNWPVGLQPPCNHWVGSPVGVYGDGGGGQMTRGYKGNLRESREALGCDWMSRAEVSQAIPPEYTTFIGHQLATYLSTTSADAPSPQTIRRDS